MKHELKQDELGFWMAIHVGPNTEHLTESAETDLGASIMAALPTQEADELTQEEADLIVSALMQIRTCNNCGVYVDCRDRMGVDFANMQRGNINAGFGCNAWERRS